MVDDWKGLQHKNGRVVLALTPAVNGSDLPPDLRLEDLTYLLASRNRLTTFPTGSQTCPT